MPSVDPRALSVDELAEVLRAAGSVAVTPDGIREQLAAGAPVRPDGRIDLIAYGAWLARECRRRGG